MNLFPQSTTAFTFGSAALQPVANPSAPRYQDFRSSSWWDQGQPRLPSPTAEPPVFAWYRPPSSGTCVFSFGTADSASNQVRRRAVASHSAQAAMAHKCSIRNPSTRPRAELKQRSRPVGRRLRKLRRSNPLIHSRLCASVVSLQQDSHSVLQCQPLRQQRHHSSTEHEFAVTTINISRWVHLWLSQPLAADLPPPPPLRSATFFPRTSLFLPFLFHLLHRHHRRIPIREWMFAHAYALCTSDTISAWTQPRRGGGEGESRILIWHVSLESTTSDGTT